MNNMKAVALTQRVFEAILKSTSIVDIENIVDNDKALFQQKFKTSIYPDLTIKLSPKEIEDLKVKGFLSDEGRIIHRLELGKLSSLEKLLYSVLWKKGDLGKERHIVQGVLEADTGVNDLTKTDGLVFYQFGKHLANRREPIIDKHTLRAYMLYKHQGNVDLEITKIRLNGGIKKKDLLILEKYKNWLGKIDTNEGDNQFHIDKVLYALGKAIKLTKKKKNANAETL